ncbi:MAG: DUF6519 domain-containing protein [Bacteroidetes bacterium]|nr:DUF6519 domain-containing protein [Bacteroidota bacterium]
MKGDFSKDTFNAEKHFRDVLLQQGRVLLDTDWNEQKAITNHRVETETIDVIGAAGTPMHDDGFEIITVDAGGNPASPGVNIKLSGGRFYVDGILCENEADVLFHLQPDFNGKVLPAVAGDYLFYLDVWQRHITWLEDETIREVALNGPDTTTRSKTIWQVKCIPVPVGTNCTTAIIPELAAPDGKMKARTELSAGTADPCGLVTSGGYRRLENQLYRVEIHRGGNRNSATFKWSRDNGSVAVKWEGQDSVNKNMLIVSSTGRDELLGFKSGNWIELISELSDLNNDPGILVQVSNVEGTTITVNPATIVRPDGTTGGVMPNWEKNKNLRIRRWDMVKDATAPGADRGEINQNKSAWIKLEDGVEVEFTNGNFRSGDYWLIPARTNTGKIEWLPDTHQAPRGVAHHFAKLAVARLNIGAAPTWIRISDCRPLFPPITQLTSLFYAGGDGQEAKPLTELPYELKAGLSNGQWPIQGAEITFEIMEGGGVFLPGNTTTVKALTDVNGIASCRWQLGAETVAPARQVVCARYFKDNVQVHMPVFYIAKLTPPELFYVSGDGQEGTPGLLLDNLISAGVSYEQQPATGRKIKFEILSGGGSVCLPDGTNPAGFQVMNTAADGIGSVKWRLGNNGQQQLKATLLNAADNPMHIPIIYNADFVRARNRSCSVTVGSGGDFDTLENAFEALKEFMDICICLLPPKKDAAGNDAEHQVKDLKVTGKDSIKITGCGAALSLIGQGMVLSAGKIELRQIGIVNDLMKPQQIVLQGNDVYCDGLTFQYARRTRASTIIPVMVIVSPFPRLKELSSLRFTNNTMEMGYTLAVVAGIDAWIENNVIEGEVWLQTDNVNINNDIPLEFNNKLALLNWGDMSPGTKKETEDALERVVRFANRNEVLHFTGNRVGRLVSDLGKEIKIPTEITQQTNVSMKGFNNAFISDNIFRGAPGSIAGDFITFTNNHLTGGNDVTVFFAIGHSGVFMGNIAPRSTGPVETLFDPGRKIPAPNICKIQ